MEEDPLLSVPLFLDFAQLLYVRLHLLRASSDLSPLGAYISEPCRKRWLRETARDVKRVEHVLIGSCRVLSCFLGERQARICVRFMSNCVETGRGGPARQYLEEDWVFARRRGVRSKPPEAILRLACPACGSAEEARKEGICPSCGRPVTDGRFGWFVDSVEIRKHEPAQPYAPSGEVQEEVGTDRPTVFAPDWAAQKRAFLIRNPSFTWREFSGFVRTTFLALQKAWSEQKDEDLRPHETDSLFSMHRYYLEQYRSAGLVNRLEQIQVEKVEGCGIESDPFFEAFTVRVFASGVDYTLDRSGKLVEGSKSRRRRFSEYWTLLRRRCREGKARAVEGGCPSCGAPLAINMAGVCSHCQSKVVTGDFGWVLCAIEQDEVYAG